MCIDIVEIWFGIAIGYILSIFTELFPHDMIMVGYYHFTFLFLSLHEIFSTVILSIPLIQEGQLSVSSERMCTILVNRLED